MDVCGLARNLTYLLGLCRRDGRQQREITWLGQVPGTTRDATEMSHLGSLWLLPR